MIDVAPADNIPRESVESEAQQQQQQLEQEPTVEVKPYIIPERNPWAPAPYEEEFDLEYSRQVASRHVIGEEEE